jgi:hypothetical protein
MKRLADFKWSCESCRISSVKGSENSGNTRLSKLPVLTGTPRIASLGRVDKEAFEPSRVMPPSDCTVCNRGAHVAGRVQEASCLGRVGGAKKACARNGNMGSLTKPLRSIIGGNKGTNAETGKGATIGWVSVRTPLIAFQSAFILFRNVLARFGPPTEGERQGL